MTKASSYKHYENYIQPLLKTSPKGGSSALLIDLAERGWLQQINKEDMMLTKAILAQYNLVFNNPETKEDFLKILQEVLAKINVEALFRINQLIENRNEDEVRGILEMYTSLIENFIRPLLTPLFYISHTRYGTELGNSDVAKLVDIAIGKKVWILKGVVDKFEGLDISAILECIDLLIRNSGTGHERWVELDDDVVEFRENEPRTGEEKKVVLHTTSELQDKLKQLKKLVWILRVSIYVFLENENISVPEKPLRTKKHIEKMVQDFGTNRGFQIVSPFDWNKIEKTIGIEIHSSNKKEMAKVNLFMGGKAYDVIYRIPSLPYVYNLMDILMALVDEIDTSKFVKLKISTYKDEVFIGNYTYATKDISDPSLKKDKLPEPEEGEFTEDTATIEYYTEITVPKGMAHLYLPKMQEQYPEDRFYFEGEEYKSV